jgi:formylglycine-generating enzyme required for sulfatase activity
MVLFVMVAHAEPVSVPPGAFRQGSGEVADESPARTVALSGYRVDRTEVSIAEFEQFVASGGYTDTRWWSPEGRAWADAHPDGAGAALRASTRDGAHPVVAVTWYEAEAYCASRGGALPSEAQWEHAACGDGGRRYPWGESEDFAAAWFKEGKFGQITDVHTQPAAREDAALASPFGLLHAAGNVWEWVRDTYDADAYASLPAKDPVNTAAGRWKTMRGGSYMNLPSYCTCTHREPARPDEVRLTAGFRCSYPS